MRTSLAALVALSASLFAYASEQSSVADVDRKLPRRALADALAATGLDVKLDASSTNAERLARGLAPSPPKRLFSPTEDRLAARASNSPTAPTYPQSGYIVATDSNNQPLGYLRTATNGDGIPGSFSLAYTNDIMQVTLDAPGQSGYSNIEVTNTPNPMWPLLGAVEGPSSSSADINGANGDFVILAYTTDTGSGTAPTADPFWEGNSFNFATRTRQEYESNVWSVDPSTGVMSMHWTKTDFTTEALVTGEITDPQDPNSMASLIAAPNPPNFTSERNVPFNEITLRFTTVAPPV